MNGRWSLTGDKANSNSQVIELLVPVARIELTTY